MVAPAVNPATQETEIGDCHTFEGSLDYLLRPYVGKRGTINFFCCYPEDLYKILYSGLYKDGYSKRFHYSQWDKELSDFPLPHCITTKGLLSVPTEVTG